MGKRVKIKDIAEKCGFSNTLVSLVLNDKASLYGIKPDTQEKVLFVARQMGYFKDIPKTANVDVKSSTASMVAMIVPELDDHFVFLISPLLNRAFSGIGLSFSLIPKNDREQKFSYLINELKKIYCGLILYGDAADDETVRNLKDSHYPFVVLEKKLVKHRINEIYSDAEEACRLVASHILRLGYKSISVIEQENSTNCIVETRLLTETITKMIPGIRLSKHILGGNGKMDPDDSNEIIRALRPPEASEMFIVKHSEFIYPLLTFLKTKKIRIPGDIAIISLDAGIGFDLMDPPLTRINRKYSQLALKTSQMLWSEVRNKGRGKFKRSVKISPELIVEKSCGTVL
jgi:DNA-binding LacI/PurR family transcriptional regulator